MHFKLIYPKWRKLDRQTHFDLPPHGPVVFAAEAPLHIDLEFVDENVSELDWDDSPDIVGLSIMLTAQLPRAIEIAAQYRRRGVTVIAGGISATLHVDELSRHVDSVFTGEIEGRLDQLLNDFKNDALVPVYDYLNSPPPIENVGTARRDILNYSKYMYRGVKMVDLFHASRGCRFDCFPCCVGYLGGRQFRPRPMNRVIEEMESIPNNRLFLVDNSLSQNDAWERELFKTMAPLKKKWISHPIKNDDELLELAHEAGCWYVYQAIFDTSDYIRRRVQSYKDHDIGVEGTIILGMDDHDEDYIKRLVDFLLELELDLAEFTIMTPFIKSPIRFSLMEQDRIINNDWGQYTCDRVVFRPLKMSPGKLQDLYYYAWDTFYSEASQEVKMGELFRKVIKREMDDGTYKPMRLERNETAGKLNE